MFGINLRVLAVLALGLACSHNLEEEYDRRSRMHLLHGVPNRLDKITTVPTNPDGGLVAGRVPELSPEESMRRKLRNEVAPIDFGRSAGGISMTMSFDEAHAILASPVGVFNDLEVFPEDIRIEWTRTEPQIPGILIIGPNYKGKLDLGALGAVSMKTQMLQYLDPEDESSLIQLFKTIGAHFEGQDPASYDCEQAFTCRLDENNAYIIFDYKRGGLLLAKDNRLALDLIYFVASRELRPFLRLPLIYRQSVAGITLESTKAETEDRIGAPVSVNGSGVHFYDDFNVAVLWNEMNQPALILARANYRGKLILPEQEPSERGLGDSFRDLAGNTASPIALTQALYQIFENSSEDCIALNACGLIDTGDGVIEVQMANSFFGFSNDASLNLLYFGISN